MLAAATTAFGDGATVVHAEPFTGGSFGSVWRVDLADRGPVVLKISATPDAGLLTYERGMLAEEANYLRTAASGAPDVPIARVLHKADDWLFMTFLPGTPLPSLPAGTDTTRVREESGAAIARLHRVTGDRFGYAGDRPSAATWPDAFAAMVDAILHDAIRWCVTLPVSPERVRAIVRAHRSMLAVVDRPASSTSISGTATCSPPSRAMARTCLAWSTASVICSATRWSTSPRRRCSPTYSIRPDIRSCVDTAA